MESLSVFIDESRNSSHHGDRPAFGVIAGLVIPQDALNKLNQDIRSRLSEEQRRNKNEAKWRDYGRSLAPGESDPGFERARIILNCVFKHAARDERIRVYVSALDGQAYENMANANTENSDGGCIYKQLMDLHYRFFMYSAGRLLGHNEPQLDHLQFSFDELQVGKKAINRLHDACNNIAQSLGVRAKDVDLPHKAPSVHLDFKDSAKSNEVQFADLMAGAACAGLDDNVKLSKRRLTLLRQMANGISAMHGEEAPAIHSTEDWQDFVTDYINRPDTRFVFQRPHLRMDDSGQRNAKRYWRYVRRHTPSVAA